jgi:hypothetical protein
MMPRLGSTKSDKTLGVRTKCYSVLSSVKNFLGEFLIDRKRQRGVARTDTLGFAQFNFFAVCQTPSRDREAIHSTTGKPVPGTTAINQ